MWENILEPVVPHMTIWRMRVACWINKAENTVCLYNTYYFSPATIAARKRINVTFYVRCLSCPFIHANLLLFPCLMFCVSLLCLTALSHCCVSLLCLTTVSHCCVSLLFLTAVSHCCVSPLCLTTVSHCCVSPLCIIAVSHRCVSLLCLTTVSNYCISPLCLTTVSHCCSSFHCFILSQVVTLICLLVAIGCCCEGCDEPIGSINYGELWTKFSIRAQLHVFS
jgi:hypothetical protein